MSYTIELSNILHHHLNEFYNQYGQDLSEDEVHEKASDYVTSDCLKFIHRPEQLSNIIADREFIYALENRMSDNEYRDFIILADDAMADLIWEYIISNY